jgi:hypothetical protein
VWRLAAIESSAQPSSTSTWLCVLNPSPETFEAVKPLLAEAYAIVAARHARNPTTSD